MDLMACVVTWMAIFTSRVMVKGTVVKMTPAGKILQEVPVLGKKPSNICFGGTDGRTAYVTEMEHGRIVQFRVDRPGLAWQRWQK